MLESLQPIHVYRPGAHYDPVEVRRVQEEMYHEFGNGQAWIHPGFSQFNIYHPPVGQTEVPRTRIDKALFPDREDIKRLYSEEDYQVYCERVRQKMRSSYPLLVFIDHTQREKTLGFLRDFPFRVEVAIEVPTEPGEPTPWWGEWMPPRDAWQELEQVLRSLEFSTIHLMGELGYWGHRTEREGCVHGARKAFNLLGFSTVTSKDLVFPGGET